MPLYEYRCGRCGEVFEVIEKFSDAPLATHEGCGGEVERLLSPPALQFKGSGWYVNDYGRGGTSSGSKEPGNGAEAKPDAKTKTETKTETKPAPAAPSPAKNT